MDCTRVHSLGNRSGQLSYGVLAVIIGLAVVGCSGKRAELTTIQSSRYTLKVNAEWDLDSTLATRFNDAQVDEDVPMVKAFKRAISFPEILPNIELLTPDYKIAEPMRPLSICYDTTSGQFFVIHHNKLMVEFNRMIQGRLGDTINEMQAFRIAAVIVYMVYKPRSLVYRTADLFLASRLRRYINDHYTPQPGRVLKEFSTDWWVWEAMPSANNDYRQLYKAYQDSMASAKFLSDIPEEALGMPQVERNGLYYDVVMFGLPTGAAREIHRYKFRLALDGQLRSSADDIAYYF
jgi:hypothetical protein